MLPIFGETNARGVGGEGKVKLRYLTFAITMSKTFGKCSSATWAPLIDKGDDKSDYIMEAFLVYWLSWHVL